MSKQFIVPVSGGKDSQLVLSWACEKHGAKNLRVVHQNTGFDHPLTYKHMRWMAHYYRVKIEHTQSSKYKDIFDFIEKVGYFPNSVARGCTSRLKQYPFMDWLRENNFLGVEACHVYMGMRADESKTRMNKYSEIDQDQVLYLPDISGEYGIEFRHVEVSLPIVDFTTEEVFAYLEKRREKVNALYQKGHHRVGCYPCLLARNSEWEAASRDPVGREHIQKLIQIEEKFKKENNPRKLIKIHQTRDVRGLMERGAEALKQEDEEGVGCGWCSI